MRLTLLCHGGTRSMREGSFADPAEPLDEGGERKARRHAPIAGMAALCSPAVAAGQTMAIVSGQGTVDPALRDLSFGAWTGRPFTDVHGADPERFAAWLADPTLAAPGGEPFAAMVERVGAWLDRCRGAERPILAITHPTVIRAALVAALDMPPAATMRIDIGPLTSVDLSCHRMWRLQAIRP